MAITTNENSESTRNQQPETPPQTLESHPPSESFPEVALPSTFPEAVTREFLQNEEYSQLEPVYHPSEKERIHSHYFNPWEAGLEASNVTTPVAEHPWSDPQPCHHDHAIREIYRPPRRKICGLPPRCFWITATAIIVVCIVVAVAVGVSIGENHHETLQGKSNSTSEPNNTTDTSPASASFPALAVLGSTDGSVVHRFSQNVTSNELIFAVYNGRWNYTTIPNTVAKNNSPIATVSLDSFNETRAYYISHSGKLSEVIYNTSSNSWTGSNLDSADAPVDSTRLAAVANSDQSIVSLFYQNKARDIVEYRWNSSIGWRQGQTLSEKAIDGTAIAATADPSLNNNVQPQVYYQATNKTILGYTQDEKTKNWSFNETWPAIQAGAPLTAITWYDNGGRKTRLYSTSPNTNKLAAGWQDPGSGEPGTDVAAAENVSPQTNLAAFVTGVGSGLKITVYYQNGKGQMMEDVYDATAGEWTTTVTG